MLSDFNCRLFDINKFNFINDDPEILEIELEKARTDIEALSKIGFHNFFCLIRHNEDILTSYTKSSVKKIYDVAHKALPKNCGKISLTVAPKIFLSPSVPYTKNLSQLAVKKTNYIFVELPLDMNPEYVPEALNKLLYQSKLIPIFTEFQIYSLFYNSQEIEKMIRIKGAAFQFNVKRIYEAQNIKLIQKILNQENKVLLGTNCEHDMLNIRDINSSLEKFKNSISAETYRNIIIDSKRFLSGANPS